MSQIILQATLSEYYFPDIVAALDGQLPYAHPTLDSNRKGRDLCFISLESQGHITAIVQNYRHPHQLIRIKKTRRITRCKSTIAKMFEENWIDESMNNPDKKTFIYTYILTDIQCNFRNSEAVADQ